MSWIRRVLAAVIVALLLALGSLPAHAASALADSDVVHGYVYDAHVIPNVGDNGALEHGLPANLATCTSAPAIDLGSYGRFACPDGGTPAVIYTYDGITYLAQAGHSWSTGAEVAPGSSRELSALRAAGVAANAERRAFSNLAPGDPIRAGGFHAISPSSLSGVSGRFNYVVGADGRLIIANRRYGHIDLANGGDVLAAGEIRVVGGQVRTINNASGHYKPYGPSAQAAAEEAFGSSGLMVRPGAYTEIVP